MDLREAEAVGQQRHPWETRRAQFFVAEALRCLPPRQPVLVLDVGSGDSWLAGKLLACLPVGSSVHCVDAHFTAVDLSRPAPAGLFRHVSVPQGLAFDLILLLDVLEHVEDDAGLLRFLAGAPLQTGGRVLLSVPAWPQLFANHDRFLHHIRRYTPDSARDLVVQCGLRVDRCGGLFHTLVVPRALTCVAERLRPRPVPSSEARWHGGPWLTAVAEAALSLDNAMSTWAVSQNIDLPGLSFWAVAKR
jgi:SAM-dependent methyltransferase